MKAESTRHYRDIGRIKPIYSEVDWSKREQVEQAIARGHSSTRIMADLKIPYAAVSTVRERMNRLADAA